MILKKLLALSLCTLFLPACSAANPTYDNLMRHPAKVQAILSHCESQQTLTSPACMTAMRAAGDINALISQEMQDPEAFGQTILDDEMAYAGATGAAEKVQLAQDIAYKLAVVGLNVPG